jgi:hypothetical protein
MPKILPYAALASALAVAGSALAQPPAPTREAAPQTAAPQTTAPPTTQQSPSQEAAPPASAAPAPSARTPSGTDAAANAGANATVMSGMSVKDNTGALIGEVKSVKNGTATIQMGSDTFSVDSDKLGVANGAATINATQAELKKMLPPKK